MRDKKDKRYRGPRYEACDRVRVWKVFGRPVGKVMWVDVDSVPIKCRVSYEYHDGRWFEETFEEDDLTLVERPYSYECNCKSVSGDHLRWCNRFEKR